MYVHVYLCVKEKQTTGRPVEKECVCVCVREIERESVGM